MGAFFLHRVDGKADGLAAQTTIERQGFSKPLSRRCGPFELLFWARQTDDFAEVAECPKGSWFAAAVGTVFYEGCHGSAALNRIVRDIENDALDWEQTLGNFAIILLRNEKVLFLNDRLQVQPVFVDYETECASSSFLGICAARSAGLRLNKRAVLEKLCTGYVVGPDTLVRGIQKVTFADQASWLRGPWTFIVPPPKDDIPASRLTRSEALSLQADTLVKYLRKIGPAAKNLGTVLGLSAGYDSRLLFAFAQHELGGLRLQTHRTRGVAGHEVDWRIVAAWAKQRRLEHILVETEPLQKLSGERLDRLAEECCLFFDGRNSHNMGVLSEVYTRAYSIATLGDAKLRLNGLGGEIYRNYYFTSRPRVRFPDWFRRHILYVTADEACAASLFYAEAQQSVFAKIGKMLNADFTGVVDRHLLRRYYSEIRMPECDGVNANAHNKVAGYLLPFIEWETVRAGYRAGPHIGMSGRFEAELIEEADPELARGPSHYGFALSCEPLNHRAKALLKGYLPDSLALTLFQARRSFRDSNEKSYRLFDELMARSLVLRESTEALQEAGLSVQIRTLFGDLASGLNALSVGCTLRMLGYNS